MSETKDKPDTKNEKADSEAIDFTGDSKNAVTVEATRNISLKMLTGEKGLPKHLAKHPGGARVEKGTKLTVSKKGADYLKKIGYAK